jgi:hypothetical protein
MPQICLGKGFLKESRLYFIILQDLSINSAQENSKSNVIIEPSFSRLL